MSAHGENHTEASTSWLASLLSCCGPVDSDDYHEKSVRDVVNEELSPVSSQQAIPSAKSPAKPSALVPRASFSSGRISFHSKRRPRATPSLRHTTISRPSDFQHLSSGAIQFPPFDLYASPTPSPPPPPRTRTAPEPRDSIYRPLELSIRMPEHHLSPILPHFDFSNVIPTPPPAYAPRNSDDEHRLVQRSSHASIPFHVPRRQTTFGHHLEETAVLTQSKPARGRAYTSPEVETLKERVAGAMIEMERLQKQIDDVIERQSLHGVSRPSTSGTMTAERHRRGQPLSPTPALPPAAPSFAERLNSDVDRPRTAPLESRFSARETSPHTSTVNKSSSALDRAGTPSPIFTNSPTDTDSIKDLPPPPLPLVFRPPLRKKKSFSRVSTWLFHGPSGEQYNGNISLESITNFPRAVKGNEGFYQCVQPGGGFSGQTPDSRTSEPLWETNEEKTAPTAWSPESTPQAEGGPLKSLERSQTFGVPRERHYRVSDSSASVGIAV